MVFQLYKKQQDIANQIQDLLFQNYTDNILLNKKLYLSGEMGVGKTYIGSYILTQYLKQVSNGYGIIVAPTTVLHKWKKVLLTANPCQKIKILKRGDILTNNITNNKNDITYEQGTIYILSIKALHVWIKTNSLFIEKNDDTPFVIIDEIHKIEKSSFDGFKMLLAVDNKRSELTMNDVKNIVIPANDYMNKDINYNLQQYSLQERLNMLEKLYKNMEQHKYDSIFNKKMPMLFLTGTIFNKEWNNIFKLIAVTHPRLTFSYFINSNKQMLNTILDMTDLVGINFSKYPDQNPNSDFDILNSNESMSLDYVVETKNEIKNNIFNFINRIWQYISLSLSLKDIKEIEKDENDVKQEIMPIKPLPLSNEQKLFIDLARLQLNRLNISNVENNAMNYIDNPNKSLILTKQPRGRKTKFLTPNKNIVSLPLLPIAFNKTAKYLKFLSLLDANKDKRFLIYANDTSLMKELSKALKDSGYQSIILNKNSKIKKSQYGIYINQQFNNVNIVIVDPRLISEGIDISADFLIWYQLIDNYSQMLQATRRIYRLSSTRKSQVYFLIYADTEQEKIVKEISNSAKNNAATQGEQATDNLSKITGILLNGIK